jgi:predicted nucleic acid-binding protein
VIPPAKLVVDTNVVIKWYVPEEGEQDAAAILNSGMTLIAPDLLVAELGNILWKKVRSGLLPRGEAETAFAAFLGDIPVELRPSVLLATTALDIANDYGPTVYDSLYLALAVVEDCQLVTADARLFNALQGTSLASRVVEL